MSEEEQEAKKVLKDLLEEFEDVEKYAIVNLSKKEFESFQVILNLIEKQREKIEKNQKFKEDVVNSIMIWDEEDLPENDRVIVCLDTIMSEFSRLENIEDEKTQVAVEFVEEKRDKYWKDKIRKKIEELEEYQKQHKEGNWTYIPIEDYDFDKINLLKELLEGE